jgi:hypothetical protein
MMKITHKQIQRIIQEELVRLNEQGCADRESGCIRQDEDGTWYILNNKKGGVWKRGYKSKQSAKDSLAAMHA